MTWWPWGRKKREVSEELAAEREKTQKSFDELDEVRAQTPKIQALSDHMVDLRLRNHFGDGLVLAMMAKGRKP